jgi:carbonic anhydrase
MCKQHSEMTRRHFGAVTLGAMSMSLLTISARAAGNAEAMVVTCIDYRFVDAATKFFDDLHMMRKYDLVSLAGASLAGVSPAFPSSNAAFWDQLVLAKKLHDVQKLIVLDHRDCGAYKAAFGEKYAGEGDAEAAQHKSVMLEVKAKLAEKFPSLGFAGYLMALGGTADKLV